MIVKSISHKRKTSFKYILEYLMNDDHNAEVVYKQLLRGNDIGSWQKQFSANSDKRKIQRKNAVHLHHDVLSFSPDSTSHLDKGTLKDIAKEYIKLRAKHTLSLAVIHREKNHVHIHIALASTDYLGNSNRLSKQEFSQLKKDIQLFQEKNYPKLEASVVNFSQSKKKTKISEKEMKMSLRTGETSDKEQLYYKVQSIFHASPDIQSFLHTLEHNDIKPYIRNGKLTGVRFNKRKFRFKTIGITEEMLLEKELNIIKTKNRNINR